MTDFNHFLENFLFAQIDTESSKIDLGPNKDGLRTLEVTDFNLFLENFLLAPIDTDSLMMDFGPNLDRFRTLEETDFEIFLRQSMQKGQKRISNMIKVSQFDIGQNAHYQIPPSLCPNSIFNHSP